MSYSVRIEQVTKKYGGFVAVDKVELQIDEGELFTLLGPSGCGKTTLLRMIAGFNTIEGGMICFGDTVINHVPAHKRDIGMVFQNYAIFPHMTVAENIAYGLKAKKMPKDQIQKKVDEALKLVQIEKLRDRKPSELSGGQQQRVALARSIVIEPGILLMDEPLSNLDAKLRVQMRNIIKKLQKRLGITTIYVTHDQEEALAISDKIAVMKEGRVVQIGTPEEIYKKPNNMFVAGFIGTSNFIECEVMSVNESLLGEIKLTEKFSLQLPLRKPYIGKATLTARPGQLKIAEEGMEGKICFATFFGEYVAYEVELETGEELEIHEYIKDTSHIYNEGERVKIACNPTLINLYSQEGGEVLSC